MIFSSLLAPIEVAINHVLAADSAAPEILAPLNERVLKLQFTDLERAVFVRFYHGRIDLYANYEGDVDLLLSGRTAQFAALARQTSSNALINSGVSATGKTALLVNLNEAVQTLDIDFESLISSVLPPSGAHILGKGFRAAVKQMSTMRNEALRLSGEHATYEAQLAVPNIEVTQFNRAVTQLRQDTDRLEAKLTALEAAR